jgi:hypothetical protein
MTEVTREQEKRILQDAKTVINKNNFFIKFAHFYITNINGLKDNFEEIWDAIVGEILRGLIRIIFSFLTIISRLIYCILPIKQIRCCFISEYIIIKDKDNLREDIKTGYWHKNAVKEIKQAIEENKKNET